MSQRNQRKASSARASPFDVVLQNHFVVKIAEKLTQYKQEIDAWLRSSENCLTPHAEFAEEKTGVNRTYLFAGFVSFIALVLLLGGNGVAGFLSHFIAFLYPAITSLKALETRNKDDYTKWLTYWLVFGFLGHFEFFGETILSVFPVYYLVKTGFQLWLCLPGDCNGSLIVYNNLLHPMAVRFLKIDSSSLKGKTDSHLNGADNLVHDKKTKVHEEVNKVHKVITKTEIHEDL